MCVLHKPKRTLFFSAVIQNSGLSEAHSALVHWKKSFCTTFRILRKETLLFISVPMYVEKLDPM